MDELVKRIIYRPSYAFLVVWFLAIVIYSLCFAMVSGVVIVYVLVFFSFMYVGEILGRGSGIRLNVKCIPFNLLAFIAFLFVLFVLFYIFLMAREILSFSSISEGMLFIRLSSLSGEYVISNYPMYVNVIQISSAFSMFCLIYSKVAGWRWRFLFFCLLFSISVISSLFDGSRSFFILGFFWFLIVLVLMGIIGVKLLIILVVFFLVLFALTFSIFRPVDSSLFVGFSYLALYFSGGVGALLSAISFDVDLGWQTVDLMVNKFKVLFYSEQRIVVEQNEFTYLEGGLKTNVYTALGIYWQYFGFYTFLLSLLYGFIGGVLSASARTNVMALWMYTLFLCTVGLSVFSDYFITYGYFVIKFLIFYFALRFVYFFAFGWVR